MMLISVPVPCWCCAQAKDRLRESDVEQMLRRVPVKLGAGKAQVGVELD